MGVPLFQEQAMKLAMEAAKFTPEEANGLRRSMATFRNMGTVGDYGLMFVDGMVRRGYDPEFAQRCFKQIEGFGSYGFPESHAVSFAKLVYVSAWIKCHYPDVFCAALLNSQPMGFYQPAQLVRDARGARRRGPRARRDAERLGFTELEPPSPSWGGTADAQHRQGGGVRSVDASPEAQRVAPDIPTRPLRGLPPHEGEGRGRACPVRLGLRQIRGLKEAEIEALVAARATAGAATLPEIARRARLSRRTLELLAEADAFRSLGMDRREGLWAVKALAPEAKAATRRHRC